MSRNSSTTAGPFTGWHFTLIMVAFFGVVVAVNLLMASLATSTFGGVVVDNSYVASQRFNGWLDKAKAQDGLGWSATAARTDAGGIALTFTGAPAAELTVTAAARHPLARLPDVALTFVRAPDGKFVATMPLAPGRWRLRIAARAGTAEWRQELDVQ